MLQGVIPEGMSKLVSLQSLDLSRNSISDVIPEGLLTLGGLRYVDFSRNNWKTLPRLPLRTLHLNVLSQLKCDVSLREAEHGARNAEEPVHMLRMNETNLLDDSGLEICLSKTEDDPYEINLSDMELHGTLSLARFELGRVTLLNLSNNSLTGALSSDIGNLTCLEHLDISQNRFCGALPQSISSLINLKTFSAAFNELTGDISQPFAQLTQLETLDVTRNQLEGEVPIQILRTANCYRLTKNPQLGMKGNKNGIYLEWNRSLRLPENIHEIGDIRELDLSNMDLYGRIPASIGLLSSLELLNLSHNNFEGRIPESIGLLTSLKVLKLSRNKLEGRFAPQGLGFPNLISLDISSTRLTHVDPKLFAEGATPELEHFKWEATRLQQPPSDMLWKQKNQIQFLRWYANQEMANCVQMKLAIVGEENIGKTVLTYRLMGKDHEAEDHFDNRQSTAGVHHELWKLTIDSDELSQLELKIWDYAGQHKYRGTHQCLFTQQALYLLLFDLTVNTEDSADCVKQWMFDIQDRVPGAVFVLVGNKADLLSSEDARKNYVNVMERVLEATQATYPNPATHPNPPIVIPAQVEDPDLLHCIVSCESEYISKSGCIDSLRTFIKHRAILAFRTKFPLLNVQRPESWQRILNSMFCLGGHPTAFVMKDEIRQHATVTEVELETGLAFWHDVGMCLWYEHSSSLRDYVFHDPVIISELLRVLIDCGQSLKEGTLTADDVPTLWGALKPQDTSARLRIDDRSFKKELVLSLLEMLDFVYEHDLLKGTFFVPLALEESECSLEDEIPRLKFKNCPRRKPFPVYELRVRRSDTFTGNLPFGLFERLLARVYRTRSDMVDFNFGLTFLTGPWQFFRDGLIYRFRDNSNAWFCIYRAKETIVLRVDSRDDTNEQYRESRRLAKHVWDTLWTIVRESFRAVNLCASIVLEDWDRGSQTCDLEFELNNEVIQMDSDGFACRPEQVICSTTSSRTEICYNLWPPSFASHPLERSLRRLARTETIQIKHDNIYFFERRHDLGKGGFGWVYIGLYDGYPVAIKQLELEPPHTEERTRQLREVEIHSTLHHTNILRMFGQCIHEHKEGEETLYLVLEFARYGDLAKLLRKKGLPRKYQERCTEYHFIDTSIPDGGDDISSAVLKQRVGLLRDVIDGITYIHEKRVMHRDIKLENVLLHENGTALLADVGLARIVSSSFNHSHGVGTCGYRAPEVDDQTYTVAADVYSFGILVVAVLTSYCPASRDKGLEDIRNINMPGLEFMLEQIYRIVANCTMLIPEQRPEAGTVLQWINMLLLQWEWGDDDDSEPRFMVPQALIPQGRLLGTDDVKPGQTEEKDLCEEEYFYDYDDFQEDEEDLCEEEYIYDDDDFPEDKDS